MMRRRRETETHFYGSHFRGGREGGKEGKLIMLWKEIKPILFSRRVSPGKKEKKNRMSKEGFLLLFYGRHEGGREVYFTEKTAINASLEGRGRRKHRF